jgi:hypothetical protein
MTLTVDQQLELYTALAFPSWLPTDDIERLRVMSGQRGYWRFTVQQLRRYLEERPDLIEQYFEYCAGLIGLHDKVVVTREGTGYQVFDQGHGGKAYVEMFEDKIEAVIKWLQYRNMN